MPAVPEASDPPKVESAAAEPDATVRLEQVAKPPKLPWRPRMLALVVLVVVVALMAIRSQFAPSALEPEMVHIPAGRFTMGPAPGEQERERVPALIWHRELPQHEVKFAKDFLLANYTVTRAEFSRFVAETGPRPPGGCATFEKDRNEQYGWETHEERDWRNPGFPQTDHDPVVCVDSRDAEDYIAWLNNETGLNFRLPTEAEWEYAARAGTKTARYWGEGRDRACIYANVSDLTLAKEQSLLHPNPEEYLPCGDGYAFTSPVGAFKPNGFGLYDMLGNVQQWISDPWHASYNGAPSDGSTWVSGGDEIFGTVRGSSWNAIPRNVRAADRSSSPTGFRVSDIGFRVARSLP